MPTTAVRRLQNSPNVTVKLDRSRANYGITAAECIHRALGRRSIPFQYDARQVRAGLFESRFGCDCIGQGRNRIFSVTARVLRDPKLRLQHLLFYGGLWAVGAMAILPITTTQG